MNVGVFHGPQAKSHQLRSSFRRVQSQLGGGAAMESLADEFFKLFALAFGKVVLQGSSGEFTLGNVEDLSKTGVGIKYGAFRIQRRRAVIYGFYEYAIGVLGALQGYYFFAVR